MKIALIGYGKMGKAIEEIILEEGKHEVVLKISASNMTDFSIENLKKVDVAIEFTQPSSAFDNVMKCFEANIPVVVGTTAWGEGLDRAKAICIEQQQTLFTAPNFSIGVNLFFQLNQYLAHLMERFPEYQVQMTEIHHTEKKDAPSGTAVQLAKDIIEDPSLHYLSWSLGASNSSNNIPIHAIREENVPGTHHVKYESNIDFINISHEAKGRRGFASGAIRAAEYIYQKKGYFTMKDMLK